MRIFCFYTGVFPCRPSLEGAGWEGKTVLHLNSHSSFQIQKEVLSLTEKNYGMTSILADTDMLAGSIKIDSRTQLGILFPALAKHLLAINVESLALGCDRYTTTSDVDRILERGGVWLPRRAYKEIFSLTEPKVVGDTIFLAGRVYLINGFDPQKCGIGVEVHTFFKAAADEYAKQDNRKYVRHYMAVASCSQGKVIFLATLMKNTAVRS